MSAQLYNASLEQRITWWKQGRKSLSKYDQHKQLTELRNFDPAWQAVPVVVLRSAIDRLDRAYSSFFRRVKRGEVPGFPRFRSSRRYQSFSIGVASIENKRVKIPKLGHVKLKFYRPLEGETKSVTIKLDASNNWWITFVCDVGDAPAKQPIKTFVGIDLGLTTLATLSTGEEISNPRFFREAQDVLARRQQELARKDKGSKSREQARILVAKINQKIQNQRLDYARKVVADLYARFDLVVFEKLSVHGLAQGSLSKSVNDAAWTILTKCLTLKAENAGKWAESVDPRGTTQECSGCEEIVPKQLGDRWHECPRCGLSINRDHNAAINVLKRARLGPGCEPKLNVRQSPKL
jgi:putative transposase